MRLNTIKNFANKFLVFFIEDSANYWHSITKCQITEKPDALGKYYLDFSSKAEYPGQFTSEGIPLYSHFGNTEIIHPIVVCQYAFGLYELLMRSNFTNQKYKNEFLKQADWLAENCVDINEGGKVWNINYEINEYGLESPWISGLSQGEAISVLTRAYTMTLANKYISVAENALKPFELSVENGGLVNEFKGNIIYEEYPSPIKTVGVLNGFIFALFGIYDLTFVMSSDRIKKIFNKGIESLVKILSYYDIERWTNYYLFDFPRKYYSSFTYHRIVTEQLRALYLITGEETFNIYYKRWLGYSNSITCRLRAILNKFLFSHKLKP